MKIIPILKSIQRSAIQFVRQKLAYSFARQTYTANKKGTLSQITQAAWNVVHAGLPAQQKRFPGNIQGVVLG